LVFLLVCAAPGRVLGGLGDQLWKLTASDAAPEDLFGGATPALADRTTHGVAIAGNLAIVGAPGDDTVGGVNAGSVYLLDMSTGQQVRQLTAEDAVEGQTFGSAVALSGNVAVVGAAANSGDTPSKPGAAYLFDAATGQQLWKFTPNDTVETFDGFGWSVAIDGNTAIVGAPLHTRQDEFFGGSAYLFDVATGQQLRKLTPQVDIRQSDDWFGISVAISGSAAIVGAWGDNEHGNFSGAAYVFDVASGQQRWKLTAEEAEAFEEFGHSVSIDGNLAAVGAPNDENENGNFSGAVYVFDVATGQRLRKISPQGAKADERIGWSVALRGNTVLAGAPGDGHAGSFAGSAYLFDAATGQQHLKLTANDTAAGDQFGWAVALDTARAVVAAPFDDDVCPEADGCESGSAYVFDASVVAARQLMAGDANQDLSFDQLDIVRVSQAAKYLTGQAATWGEGDWNGAPGGAPGRPPRGDGVFDQRDIVAALGTGLYLAGPYAGVNPGGRENDHQTSLVYFAQTGEFAVDAPAGVQLTSINIQSAAGIFTGAAAQNLGGSFDNDADDNIFKATFGSSFGSLSFGTVAPAGLDEQFVLGDLSVVGSLPGGGGLGDVDLIFIPVPEPSGVVLAATGLLLGLVGIRIRRLGRA
jgi:outer membrane protein assembly factor BamB